MSWIASNPNFSSGRIFYSINPLVICQNIGRLKIDAVERVQINYNFFARTIYFAVENHAIRDPTAGQQKRRRAFGSTGLRRRILSIMPI